MSFIKAFQQYSSERIFVRFPELSPDMRTDRFCTEGGFHYARHTEESFDKVRVYIRDQKKNHRLE